MMVVKGQSCIVHNKNNFAPNKDFPQVSVLGYQQDKVSNYAKTCEMLINHVFRIHKC